MAKKRESYGFGVEPSLAQNHYYVIQMARGQKEPARIYERFAWTPNGTLAITADGEIQMPDGQVITKKDMLRLEISKAKWKAVEPKLTAEFNNRLKPLHLSAGKFGTGGTPVERMFGKEMMVLLWAIEDADMRSIPEAVRNWQGLLPEERWWLYTMANASTGAKEDHNRGWRKALRYALCENYVEDSQKRQYSMFAPDAEGVIDET